MIGMLKKSSTISHRGTHGQVLNISIHSHQSILASKEVPPSCTSLQVETNGHLKNGTCKPHEWVLMIAVVVLLYINWFAVALTGFNFECIRKDPLSWLLHLHCKCCYHLQHLQAFVIQLKHCLKPMALGIQFRFQVAGTARWAQQNQRYLLSYYVSNPFDKDCGEFYSLYFHSIYPACRFI